MPRVADRFGGAAGAVEVAGEDRVDLLVAERFGDGFRLGAAVFGELSVGPSLQAAADVALGLDRKSVV